MAWQGRSKACNVTTSPGAAPIPPPRARMGKRAVDDKHEARTGPEGPAVDM